MKNAYQLKYFGKVQGVGFRFTVKKIADKYNIVGWVRNVPDGTVEAFAQGEELSLESFIRAVDLYFHDNIQELRQIEDVVSDYVGFQIRY